MVGAYLTQNTAWTNVERVLANLRPARLLSVKGIRRVLLAEFERLIRTSGYFRQRALRLKTKVALSENSAALSAMRKWWNDDIAPRIEP
jgi:endonuclease-3 related protein